MRSVLLVARRPLTCGGRTVGSGEVFEAAPIEAAVLTYRRQADFAPRTPSVHPSAPTSPAASALPGEAVEETLAPESVEELAMASPGRRRRQYRRRDLTAEED